jgi:hypothetical protein
MMYALPPSRRRPPDHVEIATIHEAWRALIGEGKTPAEAAEALIPEGQ